MRNMNMLQLIGGVAAAGVVAAGSTALTGNGLTTTGNAAAAQYIGGTVSQTVNGGYVLSDVAYTFIDSAKTQINGVNLTFSPGANGRAVTLAPTGGGFSSGGSAAADEFYCSGVITSNAISCVVALNNGNAHNTDAAKYYTGITSMAITVI